MSFVKLAAAAVISISFATGVQAASASIAQNGSVSSSITDFTMLFNVLGGTGPTTFAAFDPSFGTLTDVTVSFTASATGTGTVMNNANLPEHFVVSPTSNIFVSDPGTSAPAQLIADLQVGLTLAGGGSYTLAPGASATLESGPGANVFTPGSQTIHLTYIDPGILSQFTVGEFQLNLSTLSGISIRGGGGNITATQLTTAAGTIEIVYDYTVSNPPPPVNAPEPMTMAILGSGLLGLGIARRKRTQAPV